jgi:hypothetical protein
MGFYNLAEFTLEIEDLTRELLQLILRSPEFRDPKLLDDLLLTTSETETLTG